MKRESRRHPFIFRKSLGQHFLKDSNAIHKIIDACQFDRDDIILEVGPGDGALTRKLSPHVRRIFAVETDGRLCEKLTQEFDATTSKSYMRIS